MSADNTSVGGTGDATAAARFYAGQCQVHVEGGSAGYDGAAVFDASDHGPFVLIANDDCVGGDALPLAQAVARLLNGVGWDGVLLLQRAADLLEPYVDDSPEKALHQQIEAWLKAGHAIPLEGLSGADGEPALGAGPEPLDRLQLLDEARALPTMKLVVNGVPYETQAQEVKGRIAGVGLHVIWDGRTDLTVHIDTAESFGLDIGGGMNIAGGPGPPAHR